MIDTDQTNPAIDPLENPAKQVYPFALACPSFVYRTGYAENVRQLAPFVDEIQLLFFESHFADSLPSPALVQELARLGREGHITFNVHLPSDIYLGHREASERRRAETVLTDLISRCEPLEPSTFTLHLERDASEPDDGRWQANTIASLKAVLAAGTISRRISVENIDYDFNLAAPVVEQLDLSVCMDMGHLMAHGKVLTPFFERWQDRITIVHLHGVDGANDHLPLDRLAPGPMAEVMDLLNRFAGVVCLEVYSVAPLNASMAHLQNEWFRAEG